MNLFSRAPGPHQTADQQRLEYKRQAMERLGPIDPTEPPRVEANEAKFRTAADAKRRHHKRWAMNLAFFRGDQFRTWDPATQALVDTVIGQDQPSWRALISDNQIRQMTVTAVSKWNRSKNRVIGRPNNPEDPMQVAGAAAATKGVRHLEQVTRHNAKRRRADLLRAIYGTVVLYEYWDQTAKAEVATVDPTTGLAAPAGEALIGEEQYDVLTVWEVFPQPAQTWDDAEWCIKCRRRSLEWIRKTYGDKGCLVDEEAPEGDLFSLSRAEEYGQSGTAEDYLRQVPGARVKEILIRPCPEYPDGYYCAWANGILLYEEARLPHPKKRFPFVPYFGVQDPESQWGIAFIDDLLPMQDALNRSMSNTDEDISMTTRPKWQVADGADVDEDAFHNGPAEVVRWKEGPGIVPPGPIQSTPLSPQAYEWPDKLIDHMQRVAGVNEVTAEAGVPTGVKSGIAIQLLGEKDEERLALAHEDASDAWLLLFGLMLESIEKRWNIQRFVRIQGRGSEGEAAAIMGADFAGNTSVVLETQETVADSIGTKRQRYLDYVEAGLIPVQDPQTLQELLTAMEETELAQIIGRATQRAQALQQQQLAQQQAQAEAAAQAEQGAAQGQVEAQAQQAEADRQAKAQEAQAQREHQAQLASGSHAVNLVQSLLQTAQQGQAQQPPA
jgi:hypothetical protein